MPRNGGSPFASPISRISAGSNPLGTATWAYDAGGNLQSKPDYSFTWDFRDRLQSVAGPNGLLQTHSFDYAGTRVVKQVRTAATTQTILYPDRIAEVRGDKLVKYVFAGEEGAKASVPKGFDPAEIRLIGEAKGEPPFKGTLRHHGWRVVDAKLPSLAEGVDRTVIAPAEVELSAS